MLKKYITPSIYCEDLELNPVIGTACTDEYSGNVHHGAANGGIDPNSPNPISGVTLLFPNSIDCIGYWYSEDIMGNWSNMWTFHTKNGPASMFACSSITTNSGYDAGLGYPVDPYENVCYNIPWYVLGKTMQS